MLLHALHGSKCIAKVNGSKYGRIQYPGPAARPEDRLYVVQNRRLVGLLVGLLVLHLQSDRPRLEMDPCRLRRAEYDPGSRTPEGLRAGAAVLGLVWDTAAEAHVASLIWSEDCSHCSF